MNDEPKLIYNAIRTPDGTILDSKHRHDYRTYLDKNGKTYMVDGGLDYQRRSNNGDEVDMSLYDDQPHSTQRQVLRWGTYGKNGDQPVNYKTIAEMETDHLEAVLRECRPMYVLRVCMTEELKRRKE